MRIAIILGPFYPVPPVFGGAVEKVRLLLAGRYSALGHEVTIVSRRYKDFPTEGIVDCIKHIALGSSYREYIAGDRKSDGAFLSRWREAKANLKTIKLKSPE
jgi:hypothetical protein